MQKLTVLCQKMRYFSIFKLKQKNCPNKAIGELRNFASIPSGQTLSPKKFIFQAEHHLNTPLWMRIALLGIYMLHLDML